MPNPTTNVALLPFPEWGNVAMRNHTLGYDSKNHSVQVGLTKRFSNRWQASASYLWVRDYARDTPAAAGPAWHSGARNCTCW